MKKLLLQKLLVVCYLSLALSPRITHGQSTRAATPNVVLIMADDLGYGDIGCYGSTTVATSQLDSLAAHGIRLTDFHSNAPVCTPTRAALLTGKYQQRSGLEGVIYVKGETRQVGLDSTVLTLAKHMRQQGYTTGVMGKWHLGYQPEYNPVHHGFDTFYGYTSGNIDYHSHYDNASIYDWWHNLDTIREEGYVTDLITHHAVDFIEHHSREPFFLYVPHEAPHVPFQGRSDPAFRSSDTTAYFGPVADKSRAYREMIEVMDEGIGSIMRALRDNRLEENTVVIFVSDNGAIAKYGNNGGLNGQKGSLWEGGHRVPAIVYWKGKITPRTSSATVMSMDIFPTILALTQATKITDESLDGIDFSGVLLHGDTLPERPLYWRYRKQKAVRQGPWKLLITESDTALYHLEQDLPETVDLSSEHQATAKTLSTLLNRWEQEMDSTTVMKTR